MQLIQTDIDVLVEGLGGDHYRDMPGASSAYGYGSEIVYTMWVRVG